MDDQVDIEINGRELKISLRVLEKLQCIANESKERGIDTSFFKKLTLIVAYFRRSPDYVLIYLEPILEMVKHNIHPSKAFVLFDDFSKIEFLAQMDAEESVNKRMAQNKRVARAQKKRILFAKIKQEWEIEKENKRGKSLKELLADYFPDESRDEKAFNNLRQQYYRTIREEVGIDKEKIADLEWVTAEFLNSYLLDHAGIAEQEGDCWRYFKLREQFGKARSRIDRILNRTKYEQKFKEYLEAYLKRKKENS